MPARTVLWLGAPPDACKDYPSTLDKGTLVEYAKKCGAQKGKEWLLKQTGVDVGTCLNGDLNQAPECVANNYGLKLGVIKDGEVQWDVVVNDAGAVGGIAVCAATGVGAAGLAVCGQAGAALTNIAYGLVEPFVAEFVKLFWGEGKKITYCNLTKDPIDLVEEGALGSTYAVGTSRALAQWMASGTPQTLPGAIGPLFSPGGVAGTKAYWSKILIMRGLATASAIVLRGFMEQTGLPAAKAMGVLALKAPPGWYELIRPEYDGKPYDDVKLNIGALLNSFMAPDVIRKARGKDVIVPSYLLPNFWAGIPSASGITNFFELQNVNEGCVTAIMWGRRDPKIAKPSGPAIQRAKMQVYWEYTTPAAINALALADNFEFLAAMKLWRDSLKQNLIAKIALGKKLAAPKTKSSSVVPLVLALGGAAALAWWLWPAGGLLENPRLARGQTVKASTLKVGDVISNHNHHVKIIAGPTVFRDRFGLILTEWEGEIIAGDARVGERGLLRYGPEGVVRLVKSSHNENPRLPKGASLMRIQTRGVLAGAYRAKDPKNFLTHAVEVDERGNEIRVLCTRVELDSITDRYAFTKEELAEPPTCKTCLRRDPRNKA